MKLLLVICAFASAHCQPCVRTTEGDLCGTTYTLSNNRTVYAYYGIPYAAAPIGENRFQEPQPPYSWIGVRNATIRRTECVQFLASSAGAKMRGDEDCLHLNVFTPKLLPVNSKELMSVMIYIHGGAFMYGSGKRMNPEYILQNDDIVFVSFNYRLGVLGFFSTGDSRAPGNNGLKDQVAAFKWVQKNIKQFGGDPKKVTIYGVSAGAASVHYHVLSPLTKNLFQKAISASGATPIPWSLLSQTTVQNSIKLGRMLKCVNGVSSFITECLRKKPIEEIFRAGYNLVEDKHVTDIPFGPVVEPVSTNGFLCEHPIKLLRDGKIKDIPWMISVVDKEGTTPGIPIVSNETFFSTLDEKWEDRAPDMFLYNSPQFASQKNNISSLVKKHYFGDQKISNNTIEELFQALGDRLFYTPLTKVAKLHVASIKNDVYCYRFKYRGSESFADYSRGRKNYGCPRRGGTNSDLVYCGLLHCETKGSGVCHCDDQFYVVSWNGKRKNELDNQMARFFSSSIIAFMKTGNPNTPSTNWQPINKNGDMHCLSIYSPTFQRMENFENKTSIHFWENVLPNEWENSV